MTPWQRQQMIKAAGWPRAAEHLAPGADFSAPPPDEALRQRLHDTFGQSHTDAKNRLQQTLKDWDRIARKAGGRASAP